MKTKSILAMFAVVAVFGCGRPVPENHEGEVYMRSFVPKYYSAEDVKLELMFMSDIIDPAFSRAYISVSATDIGGEYAYNSVGEAKVKYDAICAKNGDMEFNRYGPVDYPTVLWGAAGVFDANFTSISIKANEDYDATHPAGAELSDICSARFLSAYPYIKNGYDVSNNFVQVTQVSVDPVSAGGDNFKIMGNGKDYELLRIYITDFYFHFSRDAVYTITLTTDDERVFSKTFANIATVIETAHVTQ